MKFWVATAWMDPTELISVSRLLDDAGMHGLMVSDHLAYPRKMESRYPSSPHPDGRPIWEADAVWPDPWVLIGALAAVTQQLNLATNVYVAPMRPILQVAKEVGTAAVISNNRVALGAGAGWMREEFELQGQSFTNRGKRFTEMIVALRELWKGGWVEFHGDYYDIPAMTMEPHPTEPVPIYVGGHSDAALRRAAQVGDGWIGNAYPWEEAEQYVTKLRTFLAEEGRENDDFEIICGLYAIPEADLFKRAEEELGITGALCRPWALDPDINAMEAAGTTPKAADYLPSIEKFVGEILGPCQP